MLVLTRKLNEGILLLDGQIRIVVLSVQGDQVKLGIDAPRDISVMREEIFAAQAENRRAAESISPEQLSSLTNPKPSKPSRHPKPKSP